MDQGLTVSDQYMSSVTFLQNSQGPQGFVLSVWNDSQHFATLHDWVILNSKHPYRNYYSASSSYRFEISIIETYIWWKLGIIIWIIVLIWTIYPFSQQVLTVIFHNILTSFIPLKETTNHSLPKYVIYGSNIFPFHTKKNITIILITQMHQLLLCPSRAILIWIHEKIHFLYFVSKILVNCS